VPNRAKRSAAGEVDDASGAEQTRPDGTFVKEIDEFHRLNRAIRSRSRVAPGSPVPAAPPEEGVHSGESRRRGRF
jgi:hypothetical protein